MRSIVAVLLILQTLMGYSQKPRVFQIDGERMVNLKKKIQQKDPAAIELVNRLRVHAERYLTMRPVSVMDKAIAPISGDKHDYLSQAPYFWYDSSKPNGLPYIRRDGQRNPEINKITDRTYLGELENASKALSLAWFLTAEKKYAEKAAALIRHWFLDIETKMNPHLEYGQFIPGINNGRYIGIIETRALTGIADAVGLLENSPSWTPADTKAMQQWYSSYLDWLLNSKHGKQERATKNNHATLYYVQAVDFALFTGNNNVAKELSEDSKKRIDSQINNQGKMQEEIDRTRGLSYSTMNLVGWFTLAKLAKHSGVDLFGYKNSSNASFKTALDYIYPYAVGEKPWPYQQITPYTREGIYTLLLLASEAYKDKRYEQYAKKIDAEVDDVMIDLIYK